MLAAITQAVNAMHNGKHFPICPLCNELVELENAKTNPDGKAVHEECYARALEQASEHVKGKPDVEQEPRPHIR